MRNILLVATLVIICVASLVTIYNACTPRPLSYPKYCQPVGGHTYCIPVEYFIFPPIDPTGFLIRATYPEMSPVPLDQAGGVRILVSDEAPTMPILPDHAENAITEYGMLVAKDASPDHKEVFYEPGQFGRPDPEKSVITCHSTEVQAGLVRKLCKQRFRQGALTFTVAFDRTLLSDWQQIKMSAIRFIEFYKQ